MVEGPEMWVVEPQ